MIWLHFALAFSFISPVVSPYNSTHCPHLLHLVELSLMQNCVNLYHELTLVLWHLVGLNFGVLSDKPSCCQTCYPDEIPVWYSISCIPSSQLEFTPHSQLDSACVHTCCMLLTLLLALLLPQMCQYSMDIYPHAATSYHDVCHVMQLH